MSRTKGSRNAKGTIRSVMSNGYIRLFRPEHPLARTDGYVLEHRLVVYDAGWPVPTGHHVHHKNGNKADNRLENLEVVEESTHHRRHMAEAGEVVNQFGTFPVARTEEERQARNRQKWADDRARSRQNGAPCAVCGARCSRGKPTCSKACGYVFRSRKGVQ